MSLITNENIYQMSLEAWQIDAIKKFERKMTDKERPFPCIPATIGYHQNHFCYGFVSCLHNPVAPRELARLLKDYSTIFKYIGDYTSLIIFYEPSSENGVNASVEQYEQMFWEQLNQLTRLDEREWPSHIPIDPKQPMWEFCFDGEQYFMYCATPSHINRLSRHFPYFMLAITPRKVLEKFRSAPLHAEKVKTKIRERLAGYDSIPVHPDLNAYGQNDNYEWKQYFLRDDETTAKKCPFHKKKESKNE